MSNEETMYMPVKPYWATQQSADELERELQNIERRLAEDGSQEPLTFAERHRLKTRRQELKRLLKGAQEGEFHRPVDDQSASTRNASTSMTGVSTLTRLQIQNVRGKIGQLRREIHRVRNELERTGLLAESGRNESRQEYVPVRHYWEDGTDSGGGSRTAERSETTRNTEPEFMPVKDPWEND